MGTLDELVIVKLGWTWVYEYAALIVIIAAALLLLLLITLIAVGFCHNKNKKKHARSQSEIAVLTEMVNSGQVNAAPQQDEEAIRQELRAEMEQQIREEVAREYQNMQPATDEQTAQQIAALNNVVREKNKQIDELTAALNQSATTHSSNNNEIFKTINDLNQTNKDLQSDVTALREENARLKAQAEYAQTYAAAPAQTKATEEQRKPAAKSTTAKTTAAKPAATKKAAAKPAPAPIPDDDDDEDEYYDDYGDETSAIKVTLKYDRIKMSWVIYRSDTNRAYRRLGTKQEGLVVAKDLARRLHAQLVVHKKDGKFQKVN